MTAEPRDAAEEAGGRVIGLFLDPPMAIARVGASPEPLEAYRWALDENPHRGVQTRVVPAPTLVAEPVDVLGQGPMRLRVETPGHVTFKDAEGRVKPVAPFFELWARVQRPSGRIEPQPVTAAFLARHGSGLDALQFTVVAANRKAQARTKRAADAAIARIVFRADDYARHMLEAVSPHTEGEVPLVRPDAPLPLGHVQTFAPAPGTPSPATRLDQVRLRFTPGKGDSFGPPEASQAVASPLAPGDFVPHVTEYGRIHQMTRPENRILSSDSPWLGYSFGADDSPKWPTPMDSYDGARIDPGHSWGLIDDTCDLVIEARVAIAGQLLTAQARAFAGPPDFAPDRRPMYSIRDELEDRELPPAPLDPDTTPAEILDLFRRIFETASLVNLDQRRHWALSGNAWMHGARNKDDPQWDEGLAPRLGPASMRREDAPYADLTPDYTPGQGATLAPRSNGSERLPYTTVVQQVHARMADSPVLAAFLSRRPDRVRDLVRPPFGWVAELPAHPGLTPPAAVPVGRHHAAGHEPAPRGPLRFRDPRTLADTSYDMRMPPFMRHSMGVPLSVTRRQYDLLMAYLDKLESDPAWRAQAAGLPEEDA
ncbi:hypothetical protein [Mangrovicoccus algicola]|uniref:Uncharacterized protein n=1 Tax=Mangrovicoccus algicola TaxID=2771008 RepID=A0A8J6YUX8_9RHOB|nr:hypothetical protein [Mangrovicoccus algicola]MBE3638230.1 hypothetical protein [Mangrovicoccus algicola]